MNVTDDQMRAMDALRRHIMEVELTQRIDSLDIVNVVNAVWERAGWERVDVLCVQSPHQAMMWAEKIRKKDDEKQDNEAIRRLDDYLNEINLGVSPGPDGEETWQWSQLIWEVMQADAMEHLFERYEMQVHRDFRHTGLDVSSRWGLLEDAAHCRGDKLLGADYTGTDCELLIEWTRCCPYTVTVGDTLIVSACPTSIDWDKIFDDDTPAAVWADGWAA